MVTLPSPFPVGCFVWMTWRRIWYLARVEEVRDAELLLVHVHGEQFTKDKWLIVHRDGTTAVNSPPLRLLHVYRLAPFRRKSRSTSRHGPRASSAHSTHCSAEDAEESTLVGIVVKVLPARDASLIDVEYPTEAKDKAQWQRVQISNGYVSELLLLYSLTHSFTESLCADQRDLGIAFRRASTAVSSRHSIIV
ncbi:hypothetical protein GQ600_2374 [Phytophthora cactorum]|nr:hypothetical protein GQ600_2374 [Phytophthora cactorum]